MQDEKKESTVRTVRIPKTFEDDWIGAMAEIARKTGLRLPLGEILCAQVPVLALMGLGYLQDQSGALYTVYKDHRASDANTDLFRLCLMH